MSAEPIVSVIIPVYNRAHLVGSAVGSALAQTYSRIEVLVVDDGSTDAIEASIEPFADDGRVRLIRKSNGGVSSARNRGIDEARGTFVAFLDSDDYWSPMKLEWQIEVANKHPPTDRLLVTTQSEILSEGYRRVRPDRSLLPGESAAEYLYSRDGFVQASSLFLTRSFASDVRFHEELNQFEDHLFFISAIEKGACLVQIEEALVVLRDDRRSDRLSRKKGGAAARHFRLVAGEALNERARAAFDAAEVAPELWWTDPVAALGLQIRALRIGAISASKFTRTLVRTALPHPVHHWFQTARYRLRRDRAVGSMTE